MISTQTTIIMILIATLLGCVLGEMMRALCDMPPSKENKYNKITRFLGEILYPSYCIGMWLSKFDKNNKKH